MFKNRINGSFLIKTLSAVLAEMKIDVLRYYQNELEFSAEQLQIGVDGSPKYDICRMIIGIHKSHCIFLTKDQRRSLEKDESYQKQLVNEVLEKIRIRNYGSWFFRRKQLKLGDEFLYFPVMYELFALTMRAIRLISESAPNEFLDYYLEILQSAMSILVLVESNLMPNAYPLCRGMIEQYFKLAILEYNPDALKIYQKFRDYEIKQSCCEQKYPDEFNLDFLNRLNKSTSVKKSDYLHYGWLDGIEDYHIIVKKNPYTIYGVFDYLEESPEDLALIRRYYKMCHGYTHGSATSVRYPLLNYFEISIMLYCIIPAVFERICDTTNNNRLIEGEDVLTMLNKDFDILFDQYGKHSTENYEMYYSNS